MTRGPGYNSRLKDMRLWLHDFVCSNGTECYSREDHARRTQHQRARKIVNGTYRDLLQAVHEMAHVHCELPIDGHINFKHPALLEAARMVGLEPTEPLPRPEVSA